MPAITRDEYVDAVREHVLAWPQVGASATRTCEVLPEYAELIRDAVRWRGEDVGDLRSTERRRAS